MRVVNDSARQPVYEFEGSHLDAQRRVLFGADGQLISLTSRLFDTLWCYEPMTAAHRIRSSGLWP
jgi:hypothetical protein